MRFMVGLATHRNDERYARIDISGTEVPRFQSLRHPRFVENDRSQAYNTQH